MRPTRNRLEIPLDRLSQDGTCLVWTGTLSRGYPIHWGYGLRRIIFERTFGPVPEGSVVHTSCGNDACLLEDHLILGTRFIPKGGPRRINSRSLRPPLGREDAEAFIALRQRGWTYKRIAQQYGHSRSTIQRLVQAYGETQTTSAVNADRTHGEKDNLDSGGTSPAISSPASAPADVGDTCYERPG